MSSPVGTNATSRPKIGWKTIVGGALVALAPVAEQYVPGVTEKAVTIIQAIGGILGVFGIRIAISNNGRGV